MKKTYVSLLLLATWFAFSLNANLKNSLNKENNQGNNYTVVFKPAMMFIGMAVKTCNDLEAGPKDINNLWKNFCREKALKKIPNKVSCNVMCLYCDYESDHTQSYTAVIGCLVTSLDEVPEGMVAKVIPKSSYALFKAVGEHPKSLIDTWEMIWQTNLKRTYTGDFELYTENFISNPSQVEVFIAIED